MLYATTRPSAPQRRDGFTLVELLVSIVILGIISGMVAQALVGASRQAKEVRGQNFINQLNLTMLRLYEEEASRRIGIPGSAYSAEAANMTQLIWKRDWLRAALPMNKADIDAGASQELAASPLYRSGAPVVQRTPFLIKDGTLYREVTEYGIAATRRLSKSSQYRQRLVRTYAAINGTTDWATAYGLWTTEHESAECLYLIFASNTIDGKPLLEQLRSRDIADTDGDGMPEIVDPWGQPVLWLRTPVGYFLKNQWSADDSIARNQPTVGELKEIVARLGSDPLDILRTDPRNALVEDGADADLVDPTTASAGIEIDKYTFFVRPMIISAGNDNEFDLVATMTATGRDTTADDHVGSLPLVTRFAAPTSASFGTPVYFPDPFYSQPIVGPGGASVDAIRPLNQRLGAVVDVNGNGVDESADNLYPSLGL
ncbi:hypothetical protein K227x_44320 [Rubripirellula lacrimiformis]|uniref:Type II secretion system protein G n=1 Tax=Rubripirellula lacrimiformis TaxID=1930273 RepID=A0A517NFX2_9BACT|nr:type II secretion system protein [Rubripirellula lacrimiformis]QDT06025.1 hypothetical protein K227x_44320 [Rubripirellula lacrimiformis]